MSLDKQQHIGLFFTWSYICITVYMPVPLFLFQFIVFLYIFPPWFSPRRKKPRRICLRWNLCLFFCFLSDESFLTRRASVRERGFSTSTGRTFPANSPRQFRAKQMRKKIVSHEFAHRCLLGAYKNNFRKQTQTKKNLWRICHCGSTKKKTEFSTSMKEKSWMINTNGSSRDHGFSVKLWKLRDRRLRTQGRKIKWKKIK